MKKFFKIYNAILEQDEELPPEEVQPAPVEAPVEEPAPEPEVETLSP